MKTNKKDTVEHYEYFNQLKKSVDISHLPEVKGYNFEKDFDFNEFMRSYSTTGIQATELGSAISITNLMIKNKADIFLSFTSNMISCGVREIIQYLVKNKKVSVLCTSAGGIEEDAIKANKTFRIGDFNVKGEQLYDAGIVRIGNIFATNEHYTYFEFFVRKVFEELLDEKKKNGTKITPSRIAGMIGKHLEIDKSYDCKSSYLYWAYKNNISVYCPGIIDGSLGDIAYYFKMQNPEFEIDVLEDHKKLINYTLNCDKTGFITLGGGIAKHYLMNANIFREGFDYAVYITTSTPSDASDSGGNQEEAITWMKVKVNAPRAIVHCDASIAFPLLVAGSFAKKE